MTKKIIYFLCTGNSCRSQIAEGWAKKYLDPYEWEVKSAGIEAHGLNPNAIKAMKEVGIDISGQTSDLIDWKMLNNADFIITLCNHADESCPVTPPHIKREHWAFDDPAGKEWSEFKRVCIAIGEKIKHFSKFEG